MNYLVTGFMRSGTSAFMQALEAGGMGVLKTESRDGFNEVHSSQSKEDKEIINNHEWIVSYDPELKRSTAMSYHSYVERPVGEVIRLLRSDETIINLKLDKFPNLGMGGKRYTGIVVDKAYKPNPESLYEMEPDKLTKDLLTENKNKALKVVAPQIDMLPVHEYKVVLLRRDSEEIRQSLEAAFNIKRTIAGIESTMEHLTETLNNRKDVEEIIEIQHQDLMFNPRRVFKSLGWPIDYKKAASVINTDLYRFRLGRLVVGI